MPAGPGEQRRCPWGRLALSPPSRLGRCGSSCLGGAGLGDAQLGVSPYPLAPRVGRGRFCCKPRTWPQSGAACARPGGGGGLGKRAWRDPSVGLGNGPPAVSGARVASPSPATAPGCAQAGLSPTGTHPVGQRLGSLLEDERYVDAAAAPSPPALAPALGKERFASPGEQSARSLWDP